MPLSSGFEDVLFRCAVVMRYMATLEVIWPALVTSTLFGAPSQVLGHHYRHCDAETCLTAVRLGR